jgi:GAF domain-containing protein
METVLMMVADLAVRTCSTASAASVTLLAEHRPRTVASTGAIAIALDEAQYAQGDGPSLTAVVSQEPVEIVDIRCESRWPAFAARASELGVLSSLSLPVPVAASGIGAGLNVYGAAVGGFDTAERSTLQGVVDLAAVAITDIRLYEASCTLVEQLRFAARSRAVIDQARGILMAQHGVGPDEAMAMLRARSQHENRKTRDLARQLVDDVGQPSRA